MRSGKLVSHASVWRKMHGDRWDYHDCYSTIPKYVDTYCTYSRPLHFTGNLFLSVLPQDNFIIMLFHFTFNQRVICPLIFSSFIQRNYRWQVVYILFMQCMVFVCVIWSFDEMGLREQVILSDKGNRETEQIMLFISKTFGTSGENVIGSFQLSQLNSSSVQSQLKAAGYTLEKYERIYRQAFYDAAKRLILTGKLVSQLKMVH